MNAKSEASLISFGTQQFSPERDYMMFGYPIANSSVCRLSSVMFVHPTQSVEIFAMFMCHFVP